MLRRAFYSVSIVLRPSKKKCLLMGLICVVFVIAGAWRIYKSNSVAGWLGIVFFGLGIVISFLQLLPNCSYLELTPEGFISRNLFLRTKVLKWTDVMDFSVVQFGSADRKVGFNFSKSLPLSEHRRILSRFICGREGVLPDTYGISAAELCALMIEWQKKHSSKETN